MDRPVNEVNRVNVGLVDRQAGFGIGADLVAGGVAGVELLEETLVGPDLALDWDR